MIFDCDGVLVDSEGLASRVESELARELGLNISAAEAHDLFLGKTVAGRARRHRGADRPAAVGHLRLQLGVRHRARLHARTAAGDRVARSRWNLRAAAMRSRSPRNRRSARVRFSLDVTGLAGPLRRARLRHFDGAAAQAGARISIYWRRTRLGVDPADCVVIEDSPAGAAAAIGAGMQAIGYAPGDTAEAMRGAGATCISSMSELMDAVLSLGRK